MNKFRARLGLGILLLLLGVWSSVGFMLYQSYQEVQQKTTVRATNFGNGLAMLLQEQVDQIGLALESVAGQLEQRLGQGPLDRAAVSWMLEQHLAHLGAVDALRVSNETGLVLAGRAVAQELPVSWREREYFIYARDHADAGMRVTRPLMAMISRKQVVVFSQRYNYPNGHFAGVVVATVELSAWSAMLNSFDLGPQGVAELRHEDLALLARHQPTAAPEGQPGSRLVSARLQQLVASGAKQAVYDFEDDRAGLAQKVAFRRVKGVPWFVVTAVSVDDDLASWRRNAGILLAQSLLITLVLILMARSLWRYYSKLHFDRQRLQGLFELSQKGIALTDMRGRFVEFNSAFAKLCGYPPQELKALDYWALTPAEYLEAETRQLESLEKTGQYGPYRKRYRRKDQQLVDVELNGQLIETAGGERFVWSIVVDISEQLRYEDELHAARDAAEAGSRAKSQFLATMSHELRTPLNGMLGSAQLLKRMGALPPAQGRLVDAILSAGLGLKTLLGDLIDAAQMQQGTLAVRPEAVPLERFLRDTVALYEFQSIDQGIRLELTWDGPPQACYRADPVRLRQMLGNLLHNALKFTEQGWVRLEASELSRQGLQAMVEFAVVDSGPGIKPQAQALLFRPFSQLDSSYARPSEGAGLGLSIVAGLTRQMGGETGVSSQPGHGARFWFRIPLEVLECPVTEPVEQACHDELSEVSAEPAEGALPRRVLVVEDNPVNRQLVVGFLEEQGVMVQSCNNGLEAVTAITSGAVVDMVLMDIQMPVMDGMEASRRIRQWEAACGRRRLPILALTAAATIAQHELNCAGLDAVIFKPLDLDALESHLLQWRLWGHDLPSPAADFPSFEISI
ncbi:ATP-binding protein [Malikia sp.]|uniref:ATP-binding protein n=1 Tax=Malikia sp. TaxID=2070706 RepID=UPI00261B066E|nr:ATP-binding protein [Malikia sp.]MDD2728717.1 ATP-binding protein [Malikia sp.]